jgi:hypothetical protein
MEFIHSREYLNAGDVAVVISSHQCNVLLMDDTNFNSFRRGWQYRYHGGFCQQFPAKIPAPHSGNWNVVLHLGGGSAARRSWPPQIMQDRSEF